jgi:hypothetical protein
MDVFGLFGALVVPVFGVVPPLEPEGCAQEQRGQRKQGDWPWVLGRSCAGSWPVCFPGRVQA